MPNIIYESAARQFLRAIRGKRSQVAFSRRLGYRGNVCAKWEGGHRFPTFAETLRAAERAGLDVPAALQRFHEASAPTWDPEQPQLWFTSLQGSTRQADLARRAELSRQQVGRMLSGRSRGRLPEVLALIDAMTGRLHDLIGALVPIEKVSAIAHEAQIRGALASLAITHPWSPAAQTWLESKGKVRAVTAARELGAALGIEEAEADALIEAMVRSGAAVRKRGKLMPAPPMTVEVRATAEELQKIRAHWARVSAERVERQEKDLFSFNVFAVGRDDLERVRDAQRRFYREVRAIIAESPPEVAAMLVVHTAAFEAEPDASG